THIAGRLEILEGARAGRAQQVAAVRRLEIEAYRLGRGDGAALGCDMREIRPLPDPPPLAGEGRVEVPRIGFSLWYCHASAAPESLPAGATATDRSRPAPQTAGKWRI